MTLTMAKIYGVLNRFFFEAFTCCISFVSFKTIITSLILTDDKTESRSHTMVNITGRIFENIFKYRMFNIIFTSIIYKS